MMAAVRAFAGLLIAVLILLVPRTTFAAEPQLAQGTFDLAVVAVTSVRSADGNLLITETLRGHLTGDAAGPVDELEQLVVHDTGVVEFKGIDFCSCTVAGRSGVLVFSFDGRVAANGQLTGSVRSISSSGGLAGLHFEGSLAGPTTGPNAGTYAVRLHFGP